MDVTMVEVNVNAGICGFKTRIEVAADGPNAELKITTDCPNLQGLTQELQKVDGYAECFGKVGDTGVFQVARKYCKHAACPVPTAIIKGIEVACGLALPKDVEITMAKK